VCHQVIGTDDFAGEEKLPVLHHADGTAYFNVIPKRLGKIELRLLGGFQDHGLVSKTLTLDVGLLPSRKLKGMAVYASGTEGGNFTFAYLHGNGSAPVYGSLEIYALYEGWSEPLEIDPHFATFKVKATPKATILRLDKEDELFITPVSEGHALIETDFGEFSALSCVIVTDVPDLRGFHGPDCHDLLSPGQVLGPASLSAITKKTGKASKASAPPARSITGAQGSAQLRENFVPQVRYRSDWITAKAPNRVLTAGEEIEIPLQLDTPELHFLTASQTAFPDQRPSSSLAGLEKEQLPIMQHIDGSKYIKVTPMRLGKTELVLTGGYRDGKLGLKKLTLDVERKPTGKLTKLAANPGGVEWNDFVVARTHRRDSPTPADIFFDIHAWYEGLKTPVDIDPRFATFKVTERSHVIRLDRETGKITPINPGNALVETDFEGLAYRTCVLVSSVPGNLQITLAQNCIELLPPGQRRGQGVPAR
jgi:hypothetical protein